MSSRARGACRGLRSRLPSPEISRETGHCEKGRLLMVGIPDKMDAGSGARLGSRAITGLRERFECWEHVPRLSWSAFATGPLFPRKCWFVTNQVPSLCGDPGYVELGEGPTLNWAGGTTAFLATPLLLRTATSRGKDDHHRGSFPRAGGEIYFCWSEFWTERNRSDRSGLRVGWAQFRQFRLRRLWSTERHWRALRFCRQHY
jgi:hypothetical protein